MLRFKMRIEPAIPTKDRHELETTLKMLGYRLTGGGQDVNGSASDISFNLKEEGKGDD